MKLANRQAIKDISLGQPAILAGWVHSRRDHGGLIFIDLRDATGLIQLVFRPKDKQLFKIAQKLRAEWVILVSGQLVEREKNLQNPNLATGKVEVVVDKLEILNAAKTPPFNPHDTTITVGEEQRLRWRFLDLRSSKMQQRLLQRSNYHRFIRDFMDGAGFTEVTTPILANSSPEGARDFLVPSRLHQGQFYALPQAPQQFKQLLMIGGLDKYYQIAACFRDEDPRADRLYGEFYQLDLEMAFVEEGQIVRETVNPLVAGLVEKFGKLKLKESAQLTYEQAQDKYGTDKPDLRFDLPLCDASQIFVKSSIEVFKKALEADGAVKLLVTRGLTRSQIGGLVAKAQAAGLAGLADLTLTSSGWQGPLAKFLTPFISDQIKKTFGVSLNQTLLLAAGPLKIVNRALGEIRLAVADLLSLREEKTVSVVWVVDFPFYELDEKEQKLDFAHNPFSRPKVDPTGLSLQEKQAIVADQFDLVINGYEVCSGAVRNHQASSLQAAFKALDYPPDYVRTNFGPLLTALEYGAPPHAGCAFGLDRLLMVLVGESNIREVVAFPKSGSGVDALMGSPNSPSAALLKELGL